MCRDVTEQVLVCDPSPQAQRAFRVILQRAGYHVVIAATGARALELAGSLRPRAVILELLLPDIGGIELCRQLREQYDMVILVSSTVDDPEATIDALEVGADDYVTKPLRPGEFLARLAARLRAAPSRLRVETDGIVIDLSARAATLNGQHVHLTRSRV